MNVKTEFIYIGFAELWATKSKRKIQYEIYTQWLGRQGAMRHSPINLENGP